MTPKRASAYVAALKIPVTLLCLFGTVLGAYYFFYVTLHRTYLIERNFRLLATLGDQVVASIENDDRVVQNLLRGDSDRGTRLVDWSRNVPRIQPRAANFIPFLKSTAVMGIASNYVLQLVEPESRLTWMRRSDALARATGSGVVQVGLEDLLDPLLRVEAEKGIFDALLVASPDGRVLFQRGDSKLRIAHLDRLNQRADAKTPAVLAFEGLARSPSMADVLVSGSQYKLFTQPCCGQMMHDASLASATGSGWILCGLVAQRTLSADSYAVSFSVLVLLSAILLLGLLSWPFLKFFFLGESQRVKAHDVVLVAVCTLVGISVITIGALDFFAYNRRLRVGLDDQLGQLAGDINKQAKAEMGKAADQLHRLDRAVAQIPLSDLELTTQPHLNLATRREMFEGDILDPYPFFDSFSLIDEEGEQRRKLTLGSVGTLFIPVRDREYFTHWASGPSGTEPFVEPIRSATTGAREAVLSRPSVSKDRVAALSIPLRALIDPVIVPGFGFAVINDDGKVLFHSDPQHNLSENFFVESDGNRRLRALVAARQSELVDLQYWGDDHRAFVFPMDIGQQWTLVTFYDKDLIRTVNVEWLIITLVLLLMYTGVYVCVCLGVLFVRPRYRAPWLWPDPMRSKAYVELLPPLMLLAAAFAVAIAVSKASELVVTSWLVPVLAWVLAYHSLNRSARRERLIAPVAAGLVTAALLIVLALRVESPSWRALLVALLAAGPGWVALGRARQAGGRHAALAVPVNISYGLTAGLFVILIAVLPATAFFRVGHTMQLESFIKYGQLQVALNTAERIHRDEEANAKQIKAIKDETQDETLETIVLKALQSARSKAPKLGVYQAFFFATEPVAASCDAVSGGETATSSASTVLPEMLEEFLPFYSESSVHMRELAHDRAPYRTWSWQHRGADLTFCMGDAAVPPFKSTVPVWSSDASAESIVTDLLVILILLSLIVAAVVWLVRFALHKVFVIDVIEPLWSGSTGSLEPIWGPNLFLVTGQPVADRMHASTFCHVDLACVPDDRAARAGWFDEQFDRIERSPAGQSVLLLHFEHRLQDPATDEAKLALLERIMTALNRTIVIVSAVPPGRFVGTGATAGASPTMAEEEARALGRWTTLLSKFTVVPVVAAATPPPAQPSHTPALGDWTTAGWREILWRISALGFAHSARFLEDERRDAAVGRLWKDVLPYAWHPDRPALDINQLLIEVGERSEHHYREIWETCTPAEKLVLGQIAEEGLVNEKTERTVRMLMARGLVRREPNFVVMNETFRQFVISASARAEVAMLEQQATSTWDAIRWPFMVLLIGSLTFFFATQHELFNTALGVLTGLAATLPALVKMASLFGGRKEAQ